jgi:hypothetical protein
MKVSYEHDLDPRYGWASIDIDESKQELIVMHSLSGGSRGFYYDGQSFTPTCICHAYTSSECCCEGVDWGDHYD